MLFSWYVSFLRFELSSSPDRLINRCIELQNFALYKGLQPRVEKSFITMMGFDEEGKPQQFRLRVKTKEMVEELDQKLKEASEQVQ